jgi:hypothetical protein
MSFIQELDKINTYQLNRKCIDEKPSIPIEDIEFVETPTNIEKEAIEEYNKTNNELPDNFIGFRP